MTMNKEKTEVTAVVLGVIVAGFFVVLGIVHLIAWING